jgi:hypothetical protein
VTAPPLPAGRPCGTCPYRRDVPSGVWAADEYAKLPAYDQPTMQQPTGLFLCHQQDGRICAGWAGCHDMAESLAVRLAVLTGRLDGDEAEALTSYRTPVPLWPDGVTAAVHGVRDVDEPGERAERAIGKLLNARARRTA